MDRAAGVIEHVSTVVSGQSIIVVPYVFLTESQVSRLSAAGKFNEYLSVSERVKVTKTKFLPNLFATKSKFSLKNFGKRNSVFTRKSRILVSSFFYHFAPSKVIKYTMG